MRAAELVLILLFECSALLFRYPLRQTYPANEEVQLQGTLALRSRDVPANRHHGMRPDVFDGRERPRPHLLQGRADRP